MHRLICIKFLPIPFKGRKAYISFAAFFCLYEKYHFCP